MDGTELPLFLQSTFLEATCHRPAALSMYCWITLVISISSSSPSFTHQSHTLCNFCSIQPHLLCSHIRQQYQHPPNSTKSAVISISLAQQRLDCKPHFSVSTLLLQVAPKCPVAPIPGAITSVNVDPAASSGVNLNVSPSHGLDALSQHTNKRATALSSTGILHRQRLLDTSSSGSSKRSLSPQPLVVWSHCWSHPTSHSRALVSNSMFISFRHTTTTYSSITRCNHSAFYKPAVVVLYLSLPHTTASTFSVAPDDQSQRCRLFQLRRTQQLDYAIATKSSP